MGPRATVRRSWPLQDVHGAPGRLAIGRSRSAGGGDPAAPLVFVIAGRFDRVTRCHRRPGPLRFVSQSTLRCLLRLVLRRLAWVTAAGEGTVPDQHRCVGSEAELRCQEFLDSLVDVGGCCAVKKFPAPRSARAAIWARSGLAPGSPAPGSCRGGRPGTLPADRGAACPGSGGHEDVSARSASPSARYTR